MNNLLKKTIICICVLILILTFPDPRTNTTDNVPTLPERDIPVTLSIERLGIYAPIESVGVLGTAMAVPTAPTYVGWYSLSTRPGDIGSAVLAGHVNWLGGKPAVFSNLDTLEINDIVSVINNHGHVDDFIVTDIQRYPATADTTKVFSSDDGLAHLNLITCAGIWNILSATHEFRLIIFTEKIRGQK